MIYVKLFFTFAKIGAIGFGGGLAILPLIYQGIEEFYPITSGEFADLIGISQATPGPIAINAATFVGYEIGGFLGAVVATIGVSTPAFLFIILALKMVETFKESSIIKGTMMAIRPAAMGMISAAVVFIGSGALFYEPPLLGGKLEQVIECMNPLAVLIAVATFTLIARYKIGTVKLIVIMGIIGAVIFS